MPIALKRAYDAPASSDGTRVLVDRLWPRGLKKEVARIDAWLRDLAPSDQLRRWFHARPAQWQQFRARYLEELSEPVAAAALAELYDLARNRRKLTLIYASRNLEHNNAVVLKQLLDEGYIVQKTGNADRRQRLLFATAKGEALVAKLAGLQTRRIERALAEIGPAGAEPVRHFLRAMIDRDDPDKVLETIFKTPMNPTSPTTAKE